MAADEKKITPGSKNEAPEEPSVVEEKLENPPVEQPLTPEEAAISRESPERKFLDVENKPRSHEMSVLAARHARFGPPLDLLMGGKEAQSPMQVDFKYQLSRLMKAKIARIEKTTGSVSLRQLQDIKGVFESYTAPEKPQGGIAKYREDIQRSITEVRAALDLGKISTLSQFDDVEDTKLELLKTLEKYIDSTAILTYALTEIMPTKGNNSAVGIEAMDFLLRSGGREYVERLPALYDKYLSFGPYQFTSFAVYELNGEKRGASLINSLCRTRQIPGSVVRLNGNEHHKAAYLFAVNNLAMLVQNMPDHVAEAIMQGDNKKYITKDLVLEYIAASHHLPSNARRAFNSYANQIVRFHDPKVTGKKKPKHIDPFTGHAQAARIGEYVRKTRDNKRALHEKFGW